MPAVDSGITRQRTPAVSTGSRVHRLEGSVVVFGDPFSKRDFADVTKKRDKLGNSDASEDVSALAPSELQMWIVGSLATLPITCCVVAAISTIGVHARVPLNL